MSQQTEKTLQVRLDMILDRIENPKFLKNDGLGNEVGFWIFDYPAPHELIIRENLEHITTKLKKHDHNFEHINIFQILIDMLESRNLLERIFKREKEVGTDELRKTLAGSLSQEKVAKFIADSLLTNKSDAKPLDFVILSGLGNAWPLVRGHELLSALQDVMGSTPLILFYPGEYNGQDLYPFGMIESRNYYRAFKLVPESGNK
jgi:hypothetical protein